MSAHVLGALLGFVLSFVLTGCLIAFAKRRAIFISPIRERDSHRRPTPRIGGLAIVISFLLVVGYWLIVEPSSLQFTNRSILGLDRNLFGLLVAICLLTIVNLVDDYRGVDWRWRLLSQIAAALLIAFFGIRIQWLSNPFGGQLLLGDLDWLFVAIWLIVLTNAVNWIDGIDGLAGGVAAITLAVLLFLSLDPTVNQPQNALLAAIGLGVVSGFLPHNLLSRVFLGDTGSMFLGFLIGVLAIISGGKVATTFLVLAIPLLDSAVVAATRLLHHQPMFEADRRHLHHQLLRLGWKPGQIVLLFYAVSLLFGLIALNTQTMGKLWAALAALVLMSGFVIAYSWRR